MSEAGAGAFTRRSRSVSGRVNGLGNRVARSFDAAEGGKKVLGLWPSGGPAWSPTKRRTEPARARVARQ